MYINAIGKRNVFRILILALAAFVLFAVPALAAPDSKGETEAFGWVELTASVPEDFEHPIVAVLINDNTGEEFFIELQSVSGYKKNHKVPYGSYSVGQAYCPNDIRYAGFSEAEPFTIDKNTGAAIPIPLTVDILDVYKEDASAPEEKEPAEEAPAEATESETPSDETEEQTEEPADPDASEDEGEEKAEEETPAEEQEPSKLFKVLRTIGITLVGWAVFTVIVFAVVYYVRKLNS